MRDSYIMETRQVSCLSAPVKIRTERCLLDESEGRGSAALESHRLVSGSDA